METPQAQIPPVFAYPAAERPRTSFDPAAGAVKRRVIGLIVSLAALAVLIVAASIEPSPGGLGTHRQLNMPACGWIALMDMPCPTCGFTTAFSHAAQGNIVASFMTQPAGCALVLATAMSLLVGSYVVATGSRVACEFKRLWGRWTGWLLAGFAVAAWGFKILSYKGLL